MKVICINRPKSGGFVKCRKNGVYGKGFLCYNCNNIKEDLPFDMSSECLFLSKNVILVLERSDHEVVQEEYQRASGEDKGWF